MRKNLNELIVKLIAIKETAKGIHYTCKGNEAYSTHLLADRVAENMDNYIDSCKESILGSDKYPLQGTKYLFDAIRLIPVINPGNNKENFALLYQIIEDTLKYIDYMQVDKADENLIGNIAENLKNSKGLINLQIS